MLWRKSVALEPIIAFSPLVIGLCLLLVALVARGSYCGLLRDHPSYAATLRLMDTLDKVTPKLESAVGHLKDYEFPYGPSDASNPANPRRAAVDVRRARVALEKAVDGGRDIRALVEQMRALHRDLKRADVLRGELGYQPLRRRIHGVLSTCEWRILQLAKLVPEAVLEHRKRLKAFSTVVLKVSALSLTIGVLFLVLWLSDLRERRDVARRRLESQTRNEGD